MIHTEFADACELLDWLEVESNSSVDMNGQIQILKVELRFLSMFVRYTTDRCTEHENLQDLLTQIGAGGRNMHELNKLACSRQTESAEIDAAIGNVLDWVKLVKPDIGKAQMKVSMLSGSGSLTSGGLAAELIDQELVKPEIRDFEIEVSRSPGSGYHISYELLEEFIDSLGENIEEVPGCEAHLLEFSLKDAIKVLKWKLRFLKGLLSLQKKDATSRIN